MEIVTTNGQLKSSIFFVLFLSSTANILSENSKAVPPSTYGCDPYKECYVNGLGFEVPDPENCNNYYLCVANSFEIVIPTDQPFECPAGEFFSRDGGACEPEDGTPCRNTCHVKCAAKCSTYTLETVPYPDDCNKYSLCLSGGQIIENSCPNDRPYFNGTDCTNNRFTCCDTCVPFCDSKFTEVPDPTDCNSYYVCTEEGVPTEDTHFMCSPDQYFDTHLNQCQPNYGIQCTSTCGNGTTTVETFLP